MAMTLYLYCFMALFGAFIFHEAGHYTAYMKVMKKFPSIHISLLFFEVGNKDEYKEMSYKHKIWVHLYGVGTGLIFLLIVLYPVHESLYSLVMFEAYIILSMFDIVVIYTIFMMPKRFHDYQLKYFKEFIVKDGITTEINYAEESKWM